MSYCRFGESSDVYAYECDGGVQFWTPDKELDRLCNTFTDAYAYAVELRREHGLKISDFAIDTLREDALEEIERLGRMSFKEGNLHEQVDKLKDLNGELCAEVNRLERELRRFKDMNNEAGERIGELESLNSELWGYLDFCCQQMIMPFGGKMAHLKNKMAALGLLDGDA